MIDTEKMKALAAKLRRYAGSAFVVEAADAIDTLLVALESSKQEAAALLSTIAECRDKVHVEGYGESFLYEAIACPDDVPAFIGQTVTDLRAALEAAAADKREMIDLLKQIPQTPEQMIDFIGSNFNSMEADEWTEDKFPPEPTGDLYSVKYSLTIHDLLSAFSCHGFEDAVALSQRQEEGS